MSGALGYEGCSLKGQGKQQDGMNSNLGDAVEALKPLHGFKFASLSWYLGKV